MGSLLAHEQTSAQGEDCLPIEPITLAPTYSMNNATAASWAECKGGLMMSDARNLYWRLRSAIGSILKTLSKTCSDRVTSCAQLGPF